MSNTPTSRQLSRSEDYALRVALIAGGTVLAFDLATCLLVWAGLL